MLSSYQTLRFLTTPEHFAKVSALMRKEIIFAIIIGLLLGVMVTFGIYTANRALKKKSQPETTITTTTPTPSPTPLAPEIALKLTEPEDNRLLTIPEATVSGKTSEEAIVAILAENSEYFAQADEEGLFSEEITLIKGANNIKIVATDMLGNQAEEELTLVYTTKLETPEQ